MDLWRIRGGRRLEGECRVQGSKNAALPILAACLLCPGTVELRRVPRLLDVDAALQILRQLGCRVQQQGDRVYIDASLVSGSAIPRHLMERMRSSVFFLGALLARTGQAALSLPGGCKLGKRPIDLHLKALRELGAEIEEEGEQIFCRSSGITGREIRLPFPSVGATENILMAACAARGETLICGAAREPEILALQDFLRCLGAEIRGAGSDTIRVSAFHPRSSLCFTLPPDRIASATLCCACAACGGDLWLKDCDSAHFSTVLYFLNQAGCDIMQKNDGLRLRSAGKLRAVGPVVTAPYPGFPTDAQPLLMAALLRAEGESLLRETIFENRYRQVPELRKLGARIRLEDRDARVLGVRMLHAADLEATDLRGGAAMVLAALCAEGETLLRDSGHIRRGYEDLNGCLQLLGADLSYEGEKHGVFN
ncbi:MAG: UDP-N-acetylglucosamine 1-carboxyvinyltransferase [Oscillospiraceae bacterium]|nr:UDP-N-acetylglucosamine 1-carboxyvinyltransferase [Oscillospiraceae bacterium]